MQAENDENVKENIDTPSTKIESGDEQINEMVSDMPDVVPEAVEAAQSEQQNQYDHLTDRHGRKFDPDLHAMDGDKPRINASGKLSLKRGRKIGQTQKINLPSNQNLMQNENENRNRRYFAEVTVGMFVQTGVGVFGDEWQPEKTKNFDERENLVNVTDDYYKATGIVEPPPWAVLLIAYGSYSLRRFHRPATKSTMQKIGTGIKTIVNKFSKKVKYKKNARSNFGNNADRKNDVSVQIGGEIQGSGNSGASAGSGQTPGVER